LIKELETANQKLIEEKARLEITNNLKETQGVKSLDLGKTLKLEENGNLGAVIDKDVEEFLYILGKNFEAKGINSEKFYDRLVKFDSLFLLQNVLDTIFYFLGITFEHSDARVIQDYLEKVFTFQDSHFEIYEKLDKLLGSIIVYTSQDDERHNKSLYNALRNDDYLYSLISAYDPDNTGYISFTTFRKILNDKNIDFEEDLVEYIIYLMKKFDDSNSSIYDLKYNNLYCFKEFDIEIIFKKLSEFENLEELLQVVTITEKEGSYDGMYLKAFTKVIQIYLDTVPLDLSDQRKLLERLRNSSNSNNVEIIDIAVLKDNINRYKIVSLINKMQQYLEKENIAFKQFCVNIFGEDHSNRFDITLFIEKLKELNILASHCELNTEETNTLCDGENRICLPTLEAVIRNKEMGVVFTEDNKVDVLSQIKNYKTLHGVTGKHFINSLQKDTFDHDDSRLISIDNFITHLKLFIIIPCELNADNLDFTDIEMTENNVNLDELQQLLRENIIKDIIIHLKDKEYDNFIEGMETDIQNGIKFGSLSSLLSYLQANEIVNSEITVDDIDPSPFGKSLKDGIVNIKKLKNIAIQIDNLLDTIKAYMIRNNLKSEAFIELFNNDIVENSLVEYKRFTQILRAQGIVPSKNFVTNDYMVFLNDSRQVKLETLREVLSVVDEEIEKKMEKEKPAEGVEQNIEANNDTDGKLDQGNTNKNNSADDHQGITDDNKNEPISDVHKAEPNEIPNKDEQITGHNNVKDGNTETKPEVKVDLSNAENKQNEKKPTVKSVDSNVSAGINKIAPSKTNNPIKGNESKMTVSKPVIAGSKQGTPNKK
jgi:Ca2+-binding EF-hand superfamily protein